MFIYYLQINSIIFKRVSIKREQYIEKQGLLEVIYRRHLLETVDRYELTKEKLQEDIILLIVFWQIGVAILEFVFYF